MWPDASEGAFVRLLFEGELCAQQIRTSFDYELDTIVGTPEPVDDVMTGFLSDVQFTDMKDAFLACCPTNYTLDRISWQWYKNPSVYARQFVLDGGAGGNLTAYTANVQATVVRRPIAAERLGVGAIRVPAAVNSANMEDGELKPAFKNLLTALAATMLSPIICTAGGASTYEFAPIVLTRTPSWFSINRVSQVFPQPTARVIRRRTARLGI
jgi:hypothetical protein